MESRQSTQQQQSQGLSGTKQVGKEEYQSSIQKEQMSSGTQQKEWQPYSQEGYVSGQMHENVIKQTIPAQVVEIPGGEIRTPERKVVVPEKTVVIPEREVVIPSSNYQMSGTRVVVPGEQINLAESEIKVIQKPEVGYQPSMQKEWQKEQISTGTQQQGWQQSTVKQHESKYQPIPKSTYEQFLSKGTSGFSLTEAAKRFGESIIESGKKLMGRKYVGQFNELFGPLDDIAVGEFLCRAGTLKEQLSGNLFVAKKYLCFYSSFENVKIAIPYKNISHWEKATTRPHLDTSEIFLLTPLDRAPENVTVDGVLIHTDDNMIHQFYYIDDFNNFANLLQQNWRNFQGQKTM